MEPPLSLSKDLKKSFAACLSGAFLRLSARYGDAATSLSGISSRSMRFPIIFLNYVSAHHTGPASDCFFVIRIRVEQGIGIEMKSV